MTVLSLIVPAYNMERYLRKCLGSLVVDSCLMEKFEVIVVNDGSTDQTGVIAHEFEQNKPYTFKVINKKNGHYGSCINAALKIARGEYVKILDADDYFDTAVFSEYLRFLDRQVAADVPPDIVFNDYRFVDEEGHVGGTWDGNDKLPIPENSVFGDDYMRGNKSIQQHHALAYRTKILRGIGYHQTEGICYTDSEWVTIPFAFSHTGMYFPHVLYLYLQGRQGQSMDETSWVRNLWMMRDLAISMLKRVHDLSRNGFVVEAEGVQEYAYAMIRGVYGTCILSSRRKAVTIDLNQFDESLHQLDGDIYDRLGREIYSRRMRFRYIYSWRRKWIFHAWCVILCRFYSIMIQALICIKDKLRAW